ncbi:MAG: SPOR domain-containing protein [Bacteroidetes bacterium]|nr:SPOR domain-containing protein [Bacteroidota bacterium]MBS1649854.1 SPOR domain-containing protein [Bacteroidota bacterium]
MMNVKIIPFILCFVFIAKNSFANDTVIVRKDPRLNILSEKQAMLNKRAALTTSNGLYKGFRVQVISTNNREEALKIKTDLLTKFPDQKVYLIFQSPNFKVRIGNFLKKEDAEDFRTLLNKHYTSGVYIIADAIEYTFKDTDESNNN